MKETAQKVGAPSFVPSQAAPDEDIQYSNSSLPASASAVALPTELLQIIFEIACMAPAQWPPFKERLSRPTIHPNIMRKMRGAINLTCRRWRNIALASPSLWKTAVVQSQEGLAPGGRSAQHLYKVFPDNQLLSLEFERSHRSLLEFYVRLITSGDSAGHWSSIWPLITRALPRVYSMEMQMTMGSGSLHIFREALAIPHLNHLVLNWWHTSAESQSMDLTGATSLQTLSITFFSTSKSPGAARELRLKLPEPEACVVRRIRFQGPINTSDTRQAILSSAATLQSLDWAISERSIQNPDRSPLPDGRHFEQLTSLRLEGTLPVIFTSTIDAPNVDQLTVYGIEDDILRHLLGTSRRFPKLRYFETDLEDTEVPVGFLQAHTSLEAIAAQSLDSLTHAFSNSPESSTLPNVQAVWASVNNPDLARPPYRDEVFRSLLEQLKELLRVRYSNGTPTSVFIVHLVSMQLEDDDARNMTEMAGEYEGSAVIIHRDWGGSPFAFWGD